MTFTRFKTNITEIILFIFIVLKSFSDTSLYNTNETYASIISGMLFVTYIFFAIIAGIKFRGETTKFIMLSIILLLLILDAYYNKKTFLLIDILGILLCVRNDYIRIAKVIFAGQSISFISIVIMNFFGVFPDVIKFREDKLRYSLGFLHANNAGIYILSILILYTTLRFKNWKIKDYIVILAGIAFMIFTCKSRTCIVSAIFLLILIVFFRRFGDKITNLRLCNMVLIGFVPFMVVLTYFIAINFTELKLLKMLNMFLSDRLYINAAYFNKFSISWFGNDQVDINGLYLDSAYSNLLLSNGLIGVSLYGLACVLSMKKAIKQKCFPVIISLLLWGIVGFTETGSLFFWFNCSLLFIVAIYQSDTMESSNETSIFNNRT